MKRYITTGQNSPKLKLEEVVDAKAKRGEVVVDIKATSLNYRDLLQAGSAGVVPVSDGAGVISAIGEDVEGFHLGDRVVIGFMTGWTEGEFSLAKQATSLGGELEGVLTERIVVPANSIVHIPDDMSFEEAACLPCAGVTAWSALFERRPLQPGETVLLLGTGGVSIFALQLAKKAGARVIITSSSDDKLEQARALGADEVINYKRTPDWASEVLKHTGGLGADIAVDVAGPATLNQTLEAVRGGGRISLMGVLTGFEGPINTSVILRKRITLQGIYVGPVSTLKSLIATGIKPQIDQVFSFEQAEDAYSAIEGASHVGKIVIRVAD
jgi:NADPH:quinone reductase-like Zn-dependent oxidoreductase